MTLPRFYPIFESADWIARMLPLGVKLVQLRIKDRPEAETRAEIIRARDLCGAAGAILVVNDYWQIAIEEGCDWLHLGQEDLDSANLAAIRAAGLRIGVSTHDEAELGRALALAPDYVALGPVWPTILKQMKWHRQGTAKLTEWKARIGDIPLIAIGGLTTARAPEAFAAGADVVSAVTDITLNADPEARVRDWLRVTG
ncbi:thiamine phosphate synthase [Paenirhodobacter populi]|uniref:Thiamine-phosphate synthase n=1 Tax=Paenirhodobacter populi TaxID=2306993 RepID=A0A443JYU5_9RHOB|nr:thiamine phosphate synthase [Sinirhodobacter populi]RWR04320.1 thiamine phosphate synthase [Sinirhodobacter populi]RWR16873.1 thiamine phosphate synthase [Sinirhodobacter populi]RWR25678.1 thiamine phosphate synthase [Sinirhodobacter populi]